MAKHPHHKRPDHKRPHVRACNGGTPAWGSEALGFYVVSGKGEHIPVCDIRSYGGALSGEWHNIVYTGPGKKSAAAARHRRTALDGEIFDLKHTVIDDNDIANGGFAAMIHSRKRQSWDVWLFGPLLFLDKPFGSLVFELAHYSGRTVFAKTLKNHDVKWWAKFGTVPAGFNRCKVLQTSYFPQPGEIGNDMEALRAVRASGLAPVPLHPYVRAEWTVLSRTIGQTDCQVYEQEGLLEERP